MRILLFAGTTEGRLLAERLAEMPVETTVCVATEYGAELLRPLPATVTVRTGRMDTREMENLLRNGGYAMAVDATHPYATSVSENIRAACGRAAVPCRRLLREGSGRAKAIHVGSIGEAASALMGLPGNILLATGSTGLHAFTRVPDFAARIFPRVLPTVEALRACAKWGYMRSRIIAMQGPFSRELNRALMRQYDIGILVTKDGGRAGGFEEKMLAAEDAGVTPVVIGRPEEPHGESLEEILAALGRRPEEEACG